MANRRNGNNKNEEAVTMDKIKELLEFMFKKHEENIIKIVKIICRQLVQQYPIARLYV